MNLFGKITRLSCRRSQIFLSFLKISQACFAMDAMGTGGYPCDDEGEASDAFEGAAVTLQVCLASGQSASRRPKSHGNATFTSQKLRPYDRGSLRDKWWLINTLKALFQNSRPIVKKRSGTDPIIDISLYAMNISKTGMGIIKVWMKHHIGTPEKKKKNSQRCKVAHPCWGYLRAMCHSKSIIKPSHP